MKKTILAMVTMSALALGAPALAQGSNTNFQLRVQQLRASVQAGVQNGTINRTEAAPLRVRLRELTQLEREFRAGGYSTGERQALQQRIQILREEIRRAVQNRANGNCPPDLIYRNSLCVRPAVGQRYTAHFIAVPSRYGTRYRDTTRYLYRFDKVDRIYQVDRRTGIIIRVYRV